MAQQSLDDAMVVIQEASAAISQVSSKLNGLQSHNQEVVAALKDLSNKVANLESNPKQRARVTKAPLYIHTRELYFIVEWLVIIKWSVSTELGASYL